MNNYTAFQAGYLGIFVAVILLGWLGGPEQVLAQDDSESAVLRGLVYDSDGNVNEKTPPQVTFTAFLNENADTVLIENAPRWDGGEENIEGQGSFRLQVGNFPGLTPGDSVHLRFTDNEVGEQATYSAKVDTLPWDSQEKNPFASIDLQQVDLPARPVNVSLSINDGNDHTISWNAESGLEYVVFRRTLQDTLEDGQSRNLYARVSGFLDGSSFTDTDTDQAENYAYIVYARNNQGILSSHSPEVFQLPRVSNLTVSERTATNIALDWDPYDPAVGQLGGYQVYRRTEDGSFGNPIAYTGPETEYRDTRLEPGTTYFYKIEARDQRQNFFGSSSETSVTTESSVDGYYQYANVKMAAMIYKNINGNTITDEKVEDIKRQYEVAREFYWRNSEMRFNVEIDYYIIESNQSFSEPNVNNVADQLKQRGVYNTQYDLVFSAWPIQSGYWSIGTGANLSLPGPDRTTGFAQTQHPCGTGVVWPGEPDLDYCFTWIFIHENQHTIDDMYRRNGHPEMAHGDLPQIFNEPAGSHLDFQARMFRVFDNYLGLGNRWGDIIEVADADGDGMPDDDSRVPLDEQQFGTDPHDPDSDGDGLSDRAEAINGIYGGSDPLQAHSDSDSLADGEDPYPRYNIKSYIKKLPDSVSIQVDGELDDWNGLDTRVSSGVSYVENGDQYEPEVQMAWNEDRLYIGMNLEDIGIPEFRFEFEGDGRWHGAGNTRMSVNLSQGTFSQFRSWDAREEVREFSDNNPDDDHPGGGMWDNNPDYQEEFQRRVFHEGGVDLEVNLDFPRVQLEMSIPRNSTAGLNLVAGDSLGWNINYGKVNDKPGNWATTFDQYRFVYFNLIDRMATPADKEPELARSFTLNQNYPNPFNPTTQIQYAVPKGQEVSLKVYDVLGREVATLVDGFREAGRHTATFDAAHLSNGVYLYRLESAGQTKTRKMMLMK